MSNFDNKNLSEHIGYDLDNLIQHETEQVNTLKLAFNELASEIAVNERKEIKSFKERTLLIILFTALFGIYCFSIASSMTISYQTPQFYLIIVGCLTITQFLRFHFSKKFLNHTQSLNKIHQAISEKERSILILHDIRGDFNKMKFD